jgi:gas vesicle protein
MEEDYNSKALWFVAGAAVGATLALLFAPASGDVTRRIIGRTAAKGRDYVSEAGRDVLDRGKGLYDKGRKLADDAADLFERGKRMVEG